MAVHTFTESIIEGREIKIFGDGTNIRDYTYVDDVIDGVMSSIELPCGFEVINLGNSGTTSIRNWSAYSKTSWVKGKAELPARPAGRCPATCADLTKARSLLGYDPKVPLEEGIERFVEWY